MKTITLDTYNGEVQFPAEWLKNNMEDASLDDFLTTYTWDESEWLYIQFSMEQEEAKINKTLELLKNGKTFFRSHLKQEGIFHDCTYHDYKYQFSYFDRLGAVGDIKKNSMEEIAISIVEHGFEPCTKENLQIIK